MSDTPYISVIIPVHNGAKHAHACLAALLASSYREFEIIVVDDASTDGGLDEIHHPQLTIIRQAHRGGPAAARNAGARQARGDVLFFVDVDVLVRPDTVVRVAEAFAENPDISAVFGSYDDAPAEQNFSSQYKNLFHHYVHQRSLSEASTFWSGCGAIKREVFETIGGFSERKFSEASIEDIEMGQRLATAGFRIRLDKSIQVKHLKRWTLKSLIHTDIFRRAVPWSRLIVETGRLTNDLNLSWHDRTSTAMAALLLLLPFGFLLPLLFYVGGVAAIAIVLLNRDLYLFFFRRRGLMFTVAAFPMHVLYFLYSGITLIVCCLLHAMKRAFQIGEMGTQ